MDVKIYFYEIQDVQNGSTARWDTPATRQFIEQEPQRHILEATERTVDERLITNEGRALFGPQSQEATLLAEFSKQGGEADEDPSIIIGKHRLAPLLSLRLINTELKDGRLHFAISPIGQLALKQLL